MKLEEQNTWKKLEIKTKYDASVKYYSDIR
jgi:hypothetical protein